MDDLVTWLRAQLDDNERRAPSEHFVGSESQLHRCPAARDLEACGDLEYGEENCDCGLKQRRARVLREVEAQRRLVDLHMPANPDAVPMEGYSGWPDKPWFYCKTCGSGEPYEYPTDWPCATLKLLALPFSDRPGFREEWAV